MAADFSFAELCELPARGRRRSAPEQQPDDEQQKDEAAEADADAHGELPVGCGVQPKRPCRSSVPAPPAPAMACVGLVDFTRQLPPRAAANGMCRSCRYHQLPGVRLRLPESRFRFAAPGGDCMNDLGQAAIPADKAPRTERGRKTVRKLLEAAAQEFGARGYHEAAITGITSRAGVALGTFYTYFESKEELFRALVRDMSHATRSHVAEAVRRRAGPARRRADRPRRLHRLHPRASRALPDHRGGAVRRRGRLSRALSHLRRGLSPGPRRRRRRAARSRRGRTSCAPGR